jgi:tetratricopeptide (TPR) repeat protein
MNPAVTCQRCGVILSALSNDGLCAACMLRSVFEEPADEGIPASSGRLALPRPFGSYELLEEIGRGGMGVVYRARQPALDRVVALKLLLGGTYSSEAMLRRFQIEAAAAAALRHPGIVAIHDYGECDGQPYYTMELMDGRNLAQVSAGNPLEPRRTAQYLRDIADAVRYAHEHSILHRDLKPSNILIDHTDRARVADFGMAKRLDLDSGVTLTGQLVGSPNYAAPEQVSGREQEVGVGTDVYALGALLYHLLTGRPPFLAATLGETLRLLHGTEPVAPRELVPGVPPDLETICLKCLAKEPARRYASAAALVEDLDRFLGDRPIQARPPSFFYRARKYARRNRTVVLATAAVFGSLVVGLGLALAGYRRAVAQQRATQAARTQAETLVGFIMRDLQPSLLAHGRLPVVKKTIEETIRYFEELPPELHNLAGMRGHAQALEALADFTGRSAVNPLGEPDPKVAREAAQRAWQLRRAIVAADPADADSAAAVLEDEIQMVGNQADDSAVDWDKPNQEFIRRFRELEARFPDNFRVQRGLADILANRGMWLDDLNAANEALHRWEQLIAGHPNDNGLRAEYIVSLGGMANHYKNEGQAEKSLAAGKKAVAAAQALLKTDPANLRFLSLATAMERENIWWSEPAALPQAIEAARTARGHYQMLRLLDPTNPGWREKESEVAGFEALLLSWDNQPGPALKILEELIGQTETVNSAPGRQALLNLLEFSGEIAATTGDLPAARARLQSIREGLKAYPLDYPERTVDRAVARFTWLRSQAQLVVALQDWPELARLGQEMIDEMEHDLYAQPGGESRLRPRRAEAQAFLGKALLRQGRSKEALVLLQQAAAGLLAGGDWTFSGDAGKDLAVLNREDLPEALRLAGDQGQARSLLEKALADAEAELVKRPGRWAVGRAVIQAAMRLAEVLDPAKPAEGARRQSLLNRAADLFTAAGAEAQTNAGDRELKAQIETLRRGSLTTDPH